MSSSVDRQVWTPAAANGLLRSVDRFSFVFGAAERRGTRLRIRHVQSSAACVILSRRWDTELGDSADSAFQTQRDDESFPGMQFLRGARRATAACRDSTRKGRRLSDAGACYATGVLLRVNRLRWWRASCSDGTAPSVA
nr:hypothetical protein [Gammaproteobacteria bacterium]